jgi:hypothetical protein
MSLRMPGSCLRVEKGNVSEQIWKSKHGRILTALDLSGVAGVLRAVVRGSSDEDSHGGSSEQSELGEHFVVGRY